MYYPYLRGRQYELLALRESVKNESIISKNIIPILEPVRASSTLLSTLSEFINYKHNIVVIRNPNVGDFEVELGLRNDFKEKYEELIKNPFINYAYILTSKKIDEIFAEVDTINDRNVFFIYDDSSVAEQISKRMNKANIFSLVPDKSIFRRKLKNRIILEDCFNKQDRNADYEKNIDEYFSENQLIYLDDDWSGFSDFSIVGDNYTESGFSPKVVAIHMVYFSNDNILRVHHFLSKNDDSIENIPGKFNEALTELLSFPFFSEVNNKSFALSQFDELKNQEKFPGLGTVKKLSIMHHLELMSNFLG